MSWNADLCQCCDISIGEWNYTHNTNGMANAVIGESWWKKLHGMTGEDGAVLLSTIIDGLSDDPERFRAMNPANGWGNYDQFLSVLKDMQHLSNRYPKAVWATHG